MPPRALVRAGVALMTRTGKQYQVHHHAASALGKRFLDTVELLPDDPRLAAYLHGEEIACDATLRGYAAVTVAGVPLGLCKCTQGRAKNHYPKGLRTP